VEVSDHIHATATFIHLKCQLKGQQIQLPTLQPEALPAAMPAASCFPDSAILAHRNVHYFISLLNKSQESETLNTGTFPDLRKGINAMTAPHLVIILYEPG
jgi:hypothetical protein